MLFVLETPTPPKETVRNREIHPNASWLPTRDGRMLLATDWTACHLNSSALNVPESPGRVL